MESHMATNQDLWDKLEIIGKVVVAILIPVVVIGAEAVLKARLM